MVIRKMKHGFRTVNNTLPEYRVWQCMKQRCYNPNKAYYKNYGGRGIKVCDRWANSFQNFFDDMGNKPEGFKIERIDNNGDYSPSNCRWASEAEQHRNTSRTRLITFNGKTQPLVDWASDLGMSWNGLCKRIKNWPLNRALTEHPHICGGRKIG